MIDCLIKISKQSKTKTIKSFILIFGLIFISVQQTYSQAKLDSLLNVLETQKQDTNKVKSYEQAYILLRYQDHKQARKYVNEGLKLASKLDYKIGILNSYLAIGEYYETRGQQDSALVSYIKAQSIAQVINNREGLLEALVGHSSALSSLQRLNEADSITNLGIEMANKHPIDSLSLVYFYMILSNTSYFRNDYEQSIIYDQKALNYNASDYDKRSKTLLNIASTFKVLSNFEKTDNYLKEALINAKLSPNNERLLALIRLEMAGLKVELKDYKAAKEYYSLALIHFENVNDQLMMVELYNSLGKTNRELSAYNLAIENYTKSLELLKSINSPNSEAYTYYNLGLTYLKKRDYKKAESNLLKALAEFSELQNTNMETWSMSKLSNLYAATNDYKKAYKYLEQVKKSDDSLYATTTEQNIAEIEEKYQNNKKQKEIDLLNAKNQIAQLEIDKQTGFRNYLIIAAILLVLLIAVIYNRYQIKHKANAKLKELDSVKTNFFTNISHEFRTPLTLILSPLQQLRKEELNKEALDNIDIIQQNATRLTELTNQLLELSKLEAGSLELAISQDNLNKFMRVLCASFESLASAQNIRLITELNEVPELAYFDGDKVQKIINNLLSNAFKFTSTEGEVAITAKQHGNRLAIAVRDTGKGISEEDQKQLFNRFYQSSSNTVNTAGTGVGLTLAKELAQLHKGDISINSIEGEGATFIFEFPYDKASYSNENLVSSTATSNTDTRQRSNQVIDTNVETSDESKTQILVVEDNPDLRAHISNLLKDSYNVLNAINGKIGLELAIKAVPDLIITDLMMPEMDGIQLNEAIKNNENTSHIPVILLTAKADRDTKLESLKTGADDFLVKPFDNEELFIRVENMISQRKKLQEKYTQTITLSPSKITIQSKEEAFLKKALEVVDANISNSEFTVELFQQEIGMSRMQLHRKLKALTNFSSSEFIRDIRLQRAADLLTDNNLNVSEVAYSCGFNSVSYFTQCFTQKFGVNPSKHSS
ncbi:ATP-binding protein [Winogradskyella sp.]